MSLRGPRASPATQRAAQARTRVSTEAFGGRTKQLLHEQWVASALAHEPIEVGLVPDLAGAVAGEVRDLVASELRERNRGVRLARRQGVQHLEACSPIGAISVCGGEEHSLVRELLHDEVEKLDRTEIGPVQIIEQQHERSAPTAMANPLRDGSMNAMVRAGVGFFW